MENRLVPCLNKKERDRNCEKKFTDGVGPLWERMNVYIFNRFKNTIVWSFKTLQTTIVLEQRQLQQQ